MAKFKINMVFEIEAESAEAAEEIFWEWDDREFIAASTAAETIVESAETS
jgi:hypothetical protein